MAPSVVETQNGYSDIQQKQTSKLSDTGVKVASHEDHDLVLRTFRCLIADLCQQFGGGHPGGAMGMAAIGVALFKYAMLYSPENPDYFNRDRFVLSNGHCCLWQYTFLHLLGYKNMTFEQLKTYHSDRTDSIAPGHPEIEHEGIEVTTGPLGQGISNAVGLAMATKSLAAHYNKPDFPIVNNMTYCMIGDACLQEGVALEAISLAGHWKLNNLVVMYDNNQISCDGSVDIANTEDVNAKMAACGWNVLEVADGNEDVEGILEALIQAKQSTDKPTFINIHTTIGYGSKLQGDAQAHGAALGMENVKEVKKSFGLDPEEHFHLSDRVYGFFHEIKPRGVRIEKEWKELVAAYAQKYPELYEEFDLRRQGKMTADYKKFIPETFSKDSTASRKSSGMVLNPIAAQVKNFMVGTADLTPSVNMTWKDKVDFQSPTLKTACGINGNYTGRYIHWGIREHAMCSISNGMAAFNRGTFIPVTSSFFMFYIYAAAGVRMGALQKLQIIHIATHDSIGTGEDGPTHQPVELAALYRAMPNLLYIRPCDSEETAGAYIAALEAKNNSSILSLSRQGLPQYPGKSSRDGVQKGAYVFIEDDEAKVTLLGIGAEMRFAIQTRDLLLEKYGIHARVVSFPCQRLFDAQPASYRRSVLKYDTEIPIVVIEAYAVNGWEKYADAGVSMDTFGHSLPGDVAYRYFGFNEKVIAPKVKELIERVESDGLRSLRGEFVDLSVKEAEGH